MYTALLKDSADELGAKIGVLSTELHIEDNAEDAEEIIAVKLVVLFELPDVAAHSFVCSFINAAAVDSACRFLENAGVNVLLNESAEHGNKRMLAAEAVHFAKFGIKCNRSMVVFRSSVQTD